MNRLFPHGPARSALFGFCALALVLGLLLIPRHGQAAQPPAAEEQEKVLRLGIPQALEGSGFLDHLAQAFERDTGIRLQGRTDTVWNLYALTQTCTIDAFFSNILEVEYTAMRAGMGKAWAGAFYAQYLLVGPRGNPAGISSVSILEGMASIAAQKTFFAASRDGSAASQAELYTWRMLRAEDVFLESWYLKAEPLPYRLLPLAASRKAYALTDAWSWQVFRQDCSMQPCPLEVIVGASPLMPDQYNLVTLNAEACPGVREEPARIFAEWIVTQRAQEHIAAFRYRGEPLFYPLDPRAQPKKP